MPSFEPDDDPVAASTGGIWHTFTVPIDAGYLDIPVIAKLEVRHTGGRATFSHVQFSTDATFQDPLALIAKFEGLNPESPISHTNNGAGYPWDQSGDIYCRILCEEGFNTYRVRVHLVQESNPHLEVDS